MRDSFSTYNFPLLLWMALIHLGALGALFVFSWQAVGLLLFLSWVTGGVGICLGYHRYFTHRSFETPRLFSYLMAVCGCLAGQGGPIAWVAAHRYHHANTDQHKDPHSPSRGFLWAHMGWMFRREAFLSTFETYKAYAPDLARDKFLVALDRFHYVPLFALAGVLLALGGLPALLWGFFARLVFVYHTTWFVNSAAHMWGYRTYDTPDQSRNNWWVGLLTFGEGWHNNHHAFQRSARHGFQWWEVDTTYFTIQLLSLVGLARQIQRPSTLSLKPNA